MYKELEKYKSKDQVKHLLELPDEQQIVIYLYEYKFPLGDFLEDFTKHTTKPRWKRNHYHNDLSEVYKKILNEITISRILP